MTVVTDVMVDLRADCSRCTGLCCVALAFATSEDFAFSKPVGEPCRNLLADCRCAIHPRLRNSGMTGCTTFDCFGAGQHVSATLLPGRAPAQVVLDVFAATRQLHQTLWLLTEACLRAPSDDLEDARDEVLALTHLPPAELVAAEVDDDHVNALLLEASETVRAQVAGRRNLRGRDLRDEALEDLRGANLRGALLGDLRGADLRLADLRDASLRGADLRGADLSSSLFVTQFQLNEAQGDASTLVPDLLLRPGHWT